MISTIVVGSSSFVVVRRRSSSFVVVRRRSSSFVVVRRRSPFVVLLLLLSWQFVVLSSTKWSSRAVERDVCGSEFVQRTYFVKSLLVEGSRHGGMRRITTAEFLGYILYHIFIFVSNNSWSM